MMITLELSQPPPLFPHPTAISAQSYIWEAITYRQSVQNYRNNRDYNNCMLCVDIAVNFSDRLERMKCGAAVSVLLFLLWSLVEVHSQTVPYVTFMGETLPNNSYVDLSLVGGAGSGDEIVCHTDLSTCCRGGDGPDRGDWYFPDGDRLPFPVNGPLVERRQFQRVELIRGGRSGSTPSGIYRCSIETIAVHSADNTARETVYVGLYESGGDKAIIIHSDLTIIL